MNAERPILARRSPARLLLALAAALAPACGAPQDQPTPRAALVGEWRSDCTAIGKRGRHGAVFALRFDAQGRMLAETRMFARRDCVGPTLEMTALADYDLGARSGAGVAIDYAFQTLDVTLLVHAVVVVYNSEAFAGCAKGSWRAGRPQSVLGGFCPPIRMPVRGRVHRDRVFFGSDNIAFGFLPLGLGAAPDGTRPAARSAVVFRRLPHTAPR